ncbi:metallo-hydrolase oxidoreductase [Fusarium tjaetaba]|uniref:Metallo-hydrolase oxidoreductase n=1 Tax=Fusarium tjaetaba TaxID=1567544 RepID=A0A8H5QG27_9HYPO|nr:metallo-hydrolase oxidoreductase [Fusarium tjaetaba]KAF5614622.1 metallo-hydrolase oxidoreductase [Fusarium tjaetaba]
MRSRTQQETINTIAWMASTSKTKLPGHDGPGVKVHLLDGGSFSTASMKLLHKNGSSEPFRMYDWCFLIHHQPSNRYVLWDLGCSDDYSVYTPWVNKFMLPYANVVGPLKSLKEQLEYLGLRVEQIDSVLFSHAHWDHCRPISQEFPDAQAFFGPGTKDFCSPGHLESGEPSYEVEWDGRWFGSRQHVTENWTEFEGTWVPWGTFERALDYFGDGSLWVIDAPGHMPGNLAAAVKLQSTDEWVLLGSDCCHSMALLRGIEEMATYIGEDGGVKAYLQQDIQAAQKAIDNIRKLEEDYGVHVALAHDATWMIEQTNSVLMSLLDDNKKGAWLDRVAQAHPEYPEQIAMGLRVGVIGPTGFGGSYLCVELIKRGYAVRGISRTPEKLGQNPRYTPCSIDIEKASFEDVVEALKNLDVLVNEHGPHTAGEHALQYKPFLELTRKIVICAKAAKVGYFVMVGGCGSLHYPGSQFSTCADTKIFWLYYRRGIADSHAHVSYMEERLGSMGTSLRDYRNARLAVRQGKSDPAAEKLIDKYEHTVMSNDNALDFVMAGRTSFMFFDGNTSFRWTYVSPPALYRSGLRTGSYTLIEDELPVKPAPEGHEESDLTGRLHGISAADLAIAIADEIGNEKLVGKHWSAYSDMSDDTPTPSYVRL